MRIKIIAPISTVGVISKEERESIASEGTEIEIRNLPAAPSSIEGPIGEAAAAPLVIREAECSASEGFNAVTIDCTLEPGLVGAKQAASVPVVGAREAGFLLALLLGERFTVLIPTDESIPLMIAAVRKMGLSERFASVRAVGMHVLELEDHRQLLDKLKAAGEKAIQQDGADVLVLGCTGMGLSVAAQLAQEIGIPVVEPASAAVKLAEVLATERLETCLTRRISVAADH